MWLLALIVFLVVACVWTIVFIFSLKGKINPHRFFNNEVYEDINYNTVPDKDMPQVIRGLEKASRSKIVITGLTRDNEKRIRKNLENMLEIGRKFQDFRIVIYENDSSDKTRDILEEYAQNHKQVEVIECDVPRCRFGADKAYADGLQSKSRITKMTNYRNKYLEYIYEKYSDYDYMFVCDWDMEGVFFSNGFFHALHQTEKYSAVFANGVASIPGLGVVAPYDGMAYSKGKKFEDNSIVWKFFQQFRECNNAEGPVDVDSAFNGGGLYVLKDILGLKYHDNVRCEHNSLHYQLKDKQKKLAIDTYFLVYAGMQGHF